MRPRTAWAVMTAVVVLGGCGDSDPSAPTPADLAEISDFEPEETITVDDDGYEPATLSVEPGTVIRLENEGDGPHSFTEDDQRFDTGRLLPGEATTLVLVEPGTYTFHDAEDPDRTAELRVGAR